jgi:hypothetical protein
MNCKPNDLAVIVRSVNGPRDAMNIGRIFHLIRLSEVGSDYAGTPAWETVELGPHYCLRDDCLKPIRADGLTTEDVTELYAPSAPEKVDA